MKRLINNGDIFDKYVSFEDKKFRDETIKEFNWLGHRRIAGTYKGAAYSTSLADNFMADSLRNDSNPKGSLLQAAKNYTDQKVATAGKTLYSHFITLQTDVGSFYLNLVNAHAEKYTEPVILKTDLDGKTVICSGYSAGNGLAQYISGNGNNLTVGVVDPSDGSTSGVQITTITSIRDEIA